MDKLMDLNTTEFQQGDIVHVHGMRVLIDVEPIIMANHPSGRTCYAWDGLVLNPEEVAGDPIPRNWLYTDGIGQPRAEARWNVQGNDLARWHVERP